MNSPTVRSDSGRVATARTNWKRNEAQSCWQFQISTGKNTIAAINSGVFYGYVGLAKNIIAELKKIYREKPRVIATGGYGAYLAPYIEEIEEVLPHLTHEGIALSVAAPPPAL